MDTCCKVTKVLSNNFAHSHTCISTYVRKNVRKGAAEILHTNSLSQKLVQP